MNVYDKRTLEIQWKKKLAYETGVLKHQLEELQKRVGAPVELTLEEPKVETKIVKEVWPVSYFSPFGLKGKAKAYGLDHNLPLPKLKEAIAKYEKAAGYSPAQG